MTPRERVIATIRWGTPDRIPIMYYSAAGPIYEHGEKLFDLWEAHPQDFGPVPRQSVEGPRPQDYRPDGSYHSVQTDEWGVEWEYLHYGIMGHPRSRPLDDLSCLSAYKPPVIPVLCGEELQQHRRSAAVHKANYYLMAGAGGIFERLIALRRFEDVLMDIYDDTPEINAIADMIVETMRVTVHNHLAVGVDGIAFGDDFGTESALIMGVDVWRRFFAPRYDALMAPIRAAGVDIEFHSCGSVMDLVDDLAALGVRILWPQLTVMNNQLLAYKMKAHGMTLLAHLDRRGVMPYGTPTQVKAEVRRIYDVFGSKDGGLIFYGEPDLGFPFENLVALSEAFSECKM